MKIYCTSYIPVQFVLTLQYNYAYILSFFFFERDLFLSISSLDYAELEIYFEAIKSTGMPDLMQEILKSVGKAKNSIQFMLLLKIISIFHRV